MLIIAPAAALCVVAEMCGFGSDPAEIVIDLGQKSFDLGGVLSGNAVLRFRMKFRCFMKRLPTVRPRKPPMLDASVKGRALARPNTRFAVAVMLMWVGRSRHLARSESLLLARCVAYPVDQRTSGGKPEKVQSTGPWRTSLCVPAILPRSRCLEVGISVGSPEKATPTMRSFLQISRDG